MKNEPRGIQLDQPAALCMSVCVEEREGVFRFSAQPHFTENTG